MARLTGALLKQRMEKKFICSQVSLRCEILNVGKFKYILHIKGYFDNLACENIQGVPKRNSKKLFDKRSRLRTAHISEIRKFLFSSL
jgi:hypothetical protein